VPCYNEAERLDARALQRFVAANAGVAFLLVNDGSSDATGAILDALRLSRPQSFGVLHLPENQGKAEAVRQGMLAALGRDTAYVGYWDADLATPLAALPAFLSVLDERTEIEMVIGARVRLLGRKIQRQPGRHYLGRVFATVASAVLRLPVYDTQCGAKLFRASAGLRSAFDHPFRSRWIFDVEILARLTVLSHSGICAAPLDSVYELPLAEWTDVGGTKLRSRDFVRAALDLAFIYRRYMWPTRNAVAQPRSDRTPRGATLRLHSNMERSAGKRSL
jgi:glycosyltransferase involved in cell wall biosynthesis